VNFIAGLRSDVLPPPLSGEGWGGGTRRFFVTRSPRLIP
jgi:hypothetical protein